MAYREEYYGRGRGRERQGREGWGTREQGYTERDRWRGSQASGRWGGRPEGWGADPSFGRYPYGEQFGPGEPTYGRGYQQRYYGSDIRPEPYEYERSGWGEERGWEGGAGTRGDYGTDFGREFGREYGRDFETGIPRRSETWYPTSRESRMGKHYGRGPKGYRRSDDRIREDVSDRLMWDPDIDASEIEVTVSQGVVTLMGVVEDRGEKRAAEDITEEVLGVDDVRNELKVRHGFLAGLTGEKVEEGEIGVKKSGETGRSRSHTMAAGPSTTGRT